MPGMSRASMSLTSCKGNESPCTTEGMVSSWVICTRSWVLLPCPDTPQPQGHVRAAPWPHPGTPCWPCPTVPCPGSPPRTHHSPLR